MTHPTRAFSGSIINRFTGSKILARVGQISVAFPEAVLYDTYRLWRIPSTKNVSSFCGNGERLQGFIIYP